MISDNSQKIQNKPKNYFTVCMQQTNFQKNQKEFQILKSIQGNALSTNREGEFLGWLVKN